MSGTEPCIEEVRNCWINVNQLCKFKRMMWHSCCASFPRHSMWLWRGAPEVNMSWASLLHLSSSWALPVHTGKSWWKQLWRWSLVLSCASVRETFSGYFRNLRTQLFNLFQRPLHWMLKRSYPGHWVRKASCGRALRKNTATQPWKVFKLNVGMEKTLWVVRADKNVRHIQIDLVTTHESDKCCM